MPDTLVHLFWLVAVWLLLGGDGIVGSSCAGARRFEASTIMVHRSIGGNDLSQARRQTVHLHAVFVVTALQRSTPAYFNQLAPGEQFRVYVALCM